MTTKLSFRKLRKVKISSALMVAVVSCTMIRVITWFWGPRYYKYIEREGMDSVLYKKVHPDVWENRRPNCSYKHILDSTDAVNAWDATTGRTRFDDDGISLGSYSPSHCNPLFSVAVIVTYRDRQEQLDVFLPYIHNFLRNQQIHYKIYLVEQDDSLAWNKGLLYNVGARAALAAGFPCLVLHDVDLLPLARANLYACCTAPRHLSATIDKFRDLLPYETLVGGVLAITAHQFQTINGFSNQFLEWGGEDDDLANRILSHNLTIIRCDRATSRYAMLPHRQSPPSAARRSLLARKQAAPGAGAAADGLRALVYRSMREEHHKLYTLLKIKT